MFTKFKKTKGDPLKGLGAYKQSVKRHEKNTAEIYDSNRMGKADRMYTGTTQALDINIIMRTKLMP